MKSNARTIRRWRLSFVGSVISIVALGWFAFDAGAASPSAETPRKPNILLILMDDMGWSDCAVYGAAKFSTPNIDKLAGDGLRFTSAYAACCVCSPTRGSIMTGKYPARLHLTDYIPGRDAQGEKLTVPKWTKALSHEEITLAEAIKSAGYVSGIVGKWHLGGSPRDHGFDEALAPTDASPRNNMPDLSERQANAAIEFVGANKDRPFFCYLAFNAPHLPLSPRPELLAKYKARTPGKAQPTAEYLAVIEDADAQIGRVLAKLDALDLARNTIVIFASDNGGLKGITTNEPLRGFKGMLYEGGLRVPLIVRWPGVVKPGTTTDIAVSSIDLYPTILELAATAGEARHNRTVDGISLVPLLREGKPPRRDALYWHYPHYHHGPPSGAVRAGDWKLIEFYEDGHVELFNLKEDSGEKSDLAAKMPEKARELKAKLAAWRLSVDAQMPTINAEFRGKKR